MMNPIFLFFRSYRLFISCKVFNLNINIKSITYFIFWFYIKKKNLPAKSDNDVMFCLQIIRDLSAG